MNKQINGQHLQMKEIQILAILVNSITKNGTYCFMSLSHLYQASNETRDFEKWVYLKKRTVGSGYMFIDEKSLFYLLNVLLIAVLLTWFARMTPLKQFCSWTETLNAAGDFGMSTHSLTDSLSMRMIETQSAKWGPMETGTWWKHKPFLFISKH